MQGWDPSLSVEPEIRDGHSSEWQDERKIQHHGTRLLCNRITQCNESQPCSVAALRLPNAGAKMRCDSHCSISSNVDLLVRSPEHRANLTTKDTMEFTHLRQKEEHVPHDPSLSISPCRAQMPSAELLNRSSAGSHASKHRTTRCFFFYFLERGSASRSMSLAFHALDIATETMHTFKHTLVSHRNCAAS